ncbi:Otopetrin domain containing protein [Aphelenchoides fujianensis]|nr:Otopetrin domain containing protein [Aphelenchoides fujianensis]
MRLDLHVLDRRPPKGARAVGRRSWAAAVCCEHAPDHARLLSFLRRPPAPDQVHVVAVEPPAAEGAEGREGRETHVITRQTETKTEVVVVEAAGARWIDDRDAKNSVVVALTAFYALVLTIFALIFELSHLLAAERRRTVHTKDLFFGVYMYGVSILFLFYCYVVLLLHPRWQVTILKLRTLVPAESRRLPACRSEESNDSLDAHGRPRVETSVQRRVTHDSPSAGSLFLRLGAVVFGVIGTVYHAFNASLCAGDELCQPATAAIDALSIVFIFTQMHFVFCNWKISITGSQTIARFGTMHLVAANLWTWVRYVLIEESVMDREIKYAGRFSREEGNEHAQPRHVFAPAGPSGTPHTRYCEGAECLLGSVSEIMYTSMVEYSLIGAAVMFIVWRNIERPRVPTVYVRRKHQIRMDCSKTTGGLFCGLAFLAATFTSMALFYGYTLLGRPRVAALVFGATDIGQYLIASAACVYALWQMRSLRYLAPARPHTNPNQELLDLILLSLGLSGELLYSVAGLVGLGGDGHWQPLSVVLFVVHLTRIAQARDFGLGSAERECTGSHYRALLQPPPLTNHSHQVALQSCLIYIAGKLRVHGDEALRRSQPGKQAITFLLLANVAMFLMNLLESEKAGVSEAVVNFYGKKSWVFLVRSFRHVLWLSSESSNRSPFSPLTIFYRFHSSVCLAEVWKNVYTWKA